MISEGASPKEGLELSFKGSWEGLSERSSSIDKPYILYSKQLIYHNFLRIWGFGVLGIALQCNHNNVMHCNACTDYCTECATCTYSSNLLNHAHTCTLNQVLSVDNDH